MPHKYEILIFFQHEIIILLLRLIKIYDDDKQRIGVAHIDILC